MTKESKQTKNKTFRGGSEKNRLDWLHKEPFKIFVKFSHEEELTVSFISF